MNPSVLDHVVIEDSLSEEKKEILQKTIAIGRKLEALRGLRFHKAVDIGALSRDEFVAHLRDMNERYNKPEVFVEEARVLKAFGLIPESMDFKETMRRQMEHVVVGAYDPIADTLRLLLGRTPWELEEATTHELHHALQDQNFSDRVDETGEREADAGAAIRALVEAEATLVQKAFELDSLGISLNQTRHLIGTSLRDEITPSLTRMALRGVPPYFIEKTAFHYAGAVNFAHAVYRQGGWAALNDALAHPPTSTEQILHPERYLTRPDYPTIISMDPLEAFLNEIYGYENVAFDVLGEFQIRTLLRTYLGNSHDAASAGWDGDRFFVWHPPHSAKPSLLWVTRWDSAQDAKEFVTAMVAILEARRKITLPQRSTADDDREHVQLKTEADGTMQIDLVGTTVTLFDRIREDDKAVFTLAEQFTLQFDDRDIAHGADDALPLTPLIVQTTETVEQVPTWNPETQVYENFRFNWKVTLPKNRLWLSSSPIIDPKSQHQTRWFNLKNPAHFSLFSMSNTSSRVQMDLTLEQRKRWFEHNVSKQYNHYTPISMEPWVIGGIEGFRFVYEGIDNRTSKQRCRIFKAYGVAQGDRFLVFVANCDAEAADPYNTLIDAFIEGITLFPEPDQEETNDPLK